MHKRKLFNVTLSALILLLLTVATPTVFGWQNEKPKHPHYPTPTVTPTITTCDEGYYPNVTIHLDTHNYNVQCLPQPTEEITPTATPEATPTATPSGGTPPTFAGSSTEAPGDCDQPKPGRVVNIDVLSTGSKGELDVHWSLPTGAELAHIEYGLTQSGTEHSLLNTPNDGNEIIRSLNSGSHYWFRVAGVNGCAVGEYSDWHDPLVP